MFADDDCGVSFEGAEATKYSDSAIYVVADRIPDDGGGGSWFPRSQIHDDSEVFEAGDEGTFTITEWLAEERGLS